MRRHGLGVALLMFSGLVSAQAGEVAVLRNGFSIRHDHREQRDASTRLYLDAAGHSYVDVWTGNIASIEPDDAPPPQPATTPTPRPTLSLEELVRQASARHQLDPDFLASVIAAESGGHNTAVSHKGAQGLMQLMPGTASRLGVTNSFDPEQNIEAGARHLRALLALYGDDPIRALAAYNAGTGPVDQYKGLPPYPETRAYVTRIIRDFNRRKAAQKAKLPAPKSKETANRAAGQASNSGS